MQVDVTNALVGNKPHQPEQKITHLYRHFDKDDTLLYVGISKNPIKRTSQHYECSHWYDSIVKITIEVFQSREEAILAEKSAIQKESPKFNIMRPSVKEQVAHEKSRANESKIELTKRIVNFNPLYSISEVSSILQMPSEEIKRIIGNGKMGCIEMGEKMRKNPITGEIKKIKKLRITGWQLIEYIEALSDK